MIEMAEQSGQLRAGDTIVEPTAGNTGVGLSIVALAKDTALSRYAGKCEPGEIQFAFGIWC